jgi:hypothetical protein
MNIKDYSHFSLDIISHVIPLIDVDLQKLEL